MSVGALSLVFFLGLYFLFSHIKTTYFDFSSYEGPLTTHSVLKLKIGKNSFSEGPPEKSLIAHASSFFSEKKHSLYEHITAISKAQVDPNIKGILVEIEGNTLSTSQAQDLRTALKKFKTSGKFIQAFARTFGEGGNGTVPYYVCTVAHKIWLQPRGELNLLGYGLESYFFKNILETYEILPRLGRRGDYKTITESYTQSQFTPQSKENLQSLLLSIHGQVVQDIATDRNLSVAAVTDFIDNSPHLDHEAITSGYVDQLGYMDDIKNEISAKESVPLSYITVSRYKNHYPHDITSAKIGVVVVEGPIVYGQSGVLNEETTSPSKIIQQLQQASQDLSIKAIILRINSPGGTVTGAEGIWHEVEKISHSSKPIIVSMGSVAASAGYMIAAPATKIVASPSTITGSIGVATGKVVIGKALDRFGIQNDHLKTGKNATIWSLNENFTPEQWDKVQKQLDYYYADFMNKVSKGRTLSLETVEALAKGQVWSGVQAKEKGLVDELGDFSTAIQIAKNLIKPSLKESDLSIVFLSDTSSLWDNIGNFGFLKEALSLFSSFNSLLNSSVFGEFLCLLNNQKTIIPRV